MEARGAGLLGAARASAFLDLGAEGSCCPAGPRAGGQTRRGGGSGGGGGGGGAGTKGARGGGRRRGAREVREVREVRGAWAAGSAARSDAGSSSGFSLRHPLPLPATPLTPPPGLGTGFLPEPAALNPGEAGAPARAPPSLPRPAPHAAPARPPAAPVPHLDRPCNPGVPECGPGA